MGEPDCNTLTSDKSGKSTDMAWATTRKLWWIIACVTLVRLFYTGVLAPIQLVKDEAHYWEWSRHLAGSYYTKGPGVAWLIAASTRVFGDHDWAVRLPVILISAMTALIIARLTRDITHGDQRAGFFAGLAFLLVPAYQFTAMLMTIDGPYIYCWVLTVWGMWHLVQRLRRDQSIWLTSAAVGFMLGVGGLFKYTAWLLIPGLIAYLWLCRRQFTFRGRDVAAILLGIVVFCITCSPIVIWNMQHDWPTVSHLLGRLHLPGGDEAVRSNWSITFLPLFLGTQIGIMGPAGIAVMTLSVIYAYRGRKRKDPLWPGQLLMICASLPILLFYTLIACFKPTQANWALAGYATLLVLVGQMVVEHMPRYHWLVKRWEKLPTPRPRRGYLRAKPETGFQIAWEVHVKWGIGAAVVILALPLLAHVPGLDDVIPLGRMQGKRLLATIVQQYRQQIKQETGMDPVLICDHYGDTSQLAFYLPDHPVVHSAGHLLGRRPSAYDYFADNDLNAPQLMGRPALIITSPAQRWKEHLRYSKFTTLSKARAIYRIDGYAGTRDEGSQP